MQRLRLLAIEALMLVKGFVRLRSFAEAAGLSYSAVTRYSSLRSIPDEDAATKILEAFRGVAGRIAGMHLGSGSLLGYYRVVGLYTAATVALEGRRISHVVAGDEAQLVPAALTAQYLGAELVPLRLAVVASPVSTACGVAECSSLLVEACPRTSHRRMEGALVFEPPGGGCEAEAVLNYARRGARGDIVVARSRGCGHLPCVEDLADDRGLKG